MATLTVDKVAALVADLDARIAGAKSEGIMASLLDQRAELSEQRAEIGQFPDTGTIRALRDHFRTEKRVAEVLREKIRA